MRLIQNAPLHHRPVLDRALEEIEDGAFAVDTIAELVELGYQPEELADAMLRYLESNQ